MITCPACSLVYSGSIFRDVTKYNPKFWHVDKSWMNKWDYSTGVKKEKFPGSSTVFVALTDGWHLAQLLHLNTLIIGVFLIGYHQDFYGLCIGVILYRVVFEINYRWVLLMK